MSSWIDPPSRNVIVNDLLIMATVFISATWLYSSFFSFLTCNTHIFVLICIHGFLMPCFSSIHICYIHPALFLPLYVLVLVHSPLLSEIHRVGDCLVSAFHSIAISPHCDPGSNAHGLLLAILGDYFWSAALLRVRIY